MRIEWVRNLEDVERFRDAWTALENDTTDRTLYCRHDYIMPWYRCYVGTRMADYGKPLVGFAWDGSTLVGVAPMIEAKATFARIPVWRVDCAGYNLAAGELLVRDGVHGVIELFVDSLQKEHRFELINLNGLAVDSDAYARLREHLTARGIRFDGIDFHGYAIADLKGGYEAYNKSFGWKFRSRNKNIAKKVAAAGELRIDRVTSTRDREVADKMRARMFAITESSPRVKRAGLDIERKHQPFYHDLFDMFGAQDAIDLAILTINGRDAAFMFGIVERDVYYHTMMAYHDDFAALSAGKYLLHEVLKYLPESGIHTVLSHGGYDYKSRWASRIVPQKTICVFGGGWRARLAHLVGFKLVHKKNSGAAEEVDSEPA